MILFFSGKLLVWICNFSAPYNLLNFSSSWTHLKFSLVYFFPTGYQGEAKSAQLIGQAISTNPAFITLRKIEASREIAQTISYGSNKAILNSDDLLLNLQAMNGEPPAKR